jgi:phage antirepressor YoqD-like protein
MEAIKILQKTNLLGHDLTIYGTMEQPLFIAKEVAEWLCLTNVTDMISRVDDDEVTKLNLGGLQGDVWFLTENGLYEVLMQSRKPIARQFKKGVKMILHKVRVKGGYITTKENDTPEMIMARALKVADETMKHHEVLIEQLNRLNKNQEEQIQKDAPKVLFADSVATSPQSCLVGELAKILCQNGIKIGEKRLFQWLRDNEYLCKWGERYNQPTQRAMEMGLFELKMTSIHKPDGSILVNTTTKVTGTGQIYFVNKFLSMNTISA